MAVDTQELLSAQLMTMAQQGVADNQRMAQHTQFAFLKDLFQGGQGESPVIFSGMNTSDRVPVVKSA